MNIKKDIFKEIEEQVDSNESIDLDDLSDSSEEEVNFDLANMDQIEEILKKMMDQLNQENERLDQQKDFLDGDDDEEEKDPKDMKMKAKMEQFKADIRSYEEKTKDTLGKGRRVVRIVKKKSAKEGSSGETKQPTNTTSQE